MGDRLGREFVSNMLKLRYQVEVLETSSKQLYVQVCSSEEIPGL